MCVCVCVRLRMHVCFAKMIFHASQYGFLKSERPAGFNYLPVCVGACKHFRLFL